MMNRPTQRKRRLALAAIPLAGVIALGGAGMAHAATNGGNGTGSPAAHTTPGPATTQQSPEHDNEGSETPESSATEAHEQAEPADQHDATESQEHESGAEATDSADADTGSSQVGPQIAPGAGGPTSHGGAPPTR